MTAKAIRNISYPESPDGAVRGRAWAGMFAILKKICLAANIPSPRLLPRGEGISKLDLYAGRHIAGQVIEMDGASGADTSISPSPAIA